MVKKKRGIVRKRKPKSVDEIESFQKAKKEDASEFSKPSSDLLIPEKYEFNDLRRGIINNEFSLENPPMIRHEITTESKEETKPFSKKKEVKILVFLVIMLLVVDIFSLYFYFQPDLSGFFKKNPQTNAGSKINLKCKDGTAYGSCSSNKPFYCYNGELIKKAATCGCGSGYKVDFQDCKEI